LAMLGALNPTIKITHQELAARLGADHRRRLRARSELNGFHNSLPVKPTIRSYTASLLPAARYGLKTTAKVPDAAYIR